MTEAQIAELERLAKAATPGPWEQFDAGPWGGEGAGLAIGKDPQYWPVFSKRTDAVGVANSFYVAAANPQAVLELIASWRAQAERIKALDAMLVCYRTGKRPSEKLLAEMDRTKQALSGEGGGRG